MGVAQSGANSTNNTIGLFTPPRGQYQSSRRSENDSQSAPMSKTASTVIRILRFKGRGIARIPLIMLCIRLLHLIYEERVMFQKQTFKVQAGKTELKTLLLFNS